MSLTSSARLLRARLPGVAGKAFGNSGVLFGTQIVQALLRFASFPVVAYYVDPADYGVMLAVGSLTLTLAFLSETGGAPFTVRTDGGDTPRSLNTVWTVSVIRGVLIALVLFASAPLVGDVLEEPRVTQALRICAFGTLLFECRALGPFLAQRYQNERRNALVRLGTAVVALGVQVALAVWLRDWRALAWGLVASNTLAFLASFAFYPTRHRFALNRDVLLALWRFSRMIAASSAVTLVVMQFDKYVILAVASLTVAGLFNNASNLIGIAEDLIHRHARGVFLPAAAARLRRGERSPDVFYHPLRLVRPMLLLLCCVGITAGPAAIDVLLPPRYAGVGFFLSLLSLRAALMTIAQPQAAFLLADDGQRQVFYADAARLGWTVAVGLAGILAFGVNGLVLAVALREVPPIVIQARALSARGVFSLRREASLVPVAALGLGLGAVLSLGVAATGLGALFV